MKKIRLVVGETASLPKEIIEKYEMVVLPFIVDWPEKNDLLGENIYQKMREAEKRGIKTFPKTSQPSVGTFKKVFEEELKRGEKILAITASSKLSGAYNSACQARKMLNEKDQNRLFIFDCLNVTAGEGLFVLKAAELVEKEEEIGEIFKNLKEFIPKVHLFGMVEDPKWLEAGGRLSHPLAILISQMQKIGMRPLIGIKNGLIKPVALKMQAKDVPSALFEELEKETKAEREKGKKVKVAICHADNWLGAQKLKEMIEENLKEVEIIFISLIDPIVGAHVGLGTLLCAWC